MEEIKLLHLICNLLFFLIFFSKKVILNNPDYQFLSNLVQDISDEGPSKKKKEKIILKVIIRNKLYFYFLMK